MEVPPALLLRGQRAVGLNPWAGCCWYPKDGESRVSCSSHRAELWWLGWMQRQDTVHGVSLPRPMLLRERVGVHRDLMCCRNGVHGGCGASWTPVDIPAVSCCAAVLLQGFSTQAKAASPCSSCTVPRGLRLPAATVAVND